MIRCARLGKGGRFTIPKAFRKQLGFMSGVAVKLSELDGTLVFRREGTKGCVGPRRTRSKPAKERSIVSDETNRVVGTKRHRQAHNAPDPVEAATARSRKRAKQKFPKKPRR